MRGRRKTVRISEAEWSIMKVLWDGCETTGRGLTLGEIAAELSGTTGWSSTTIRTLIIRLAEKGAVEIDKSTGVYKYTPRTKKAECVEAEVTAFVARVFDGSECALMEMLARSGKLSAEEKQNVIGILAEQ